MSLTVQVPLFDVPQLRVFSARPTDVEQGVVAHMPAGKLLTYEKLQDIPQAAIEQMRTKLGFKAGDLPPLTNGCTLYGVKYVTLGLDGRKVVASGLAVVPDKQAGASPLLSFQHGTAPGAHNGPSENLKSPERTYGVVAFGGCGHVLSLPDYLGFGAAAEPHPERFFDPKLTHLTGVNQRRVFHPYLHAASESRAALDMLRATRQLTDKLAVKLSPQLFLAGYSQGGQATMALHRLLESTPELRKEFPVTASTPMAGPHDIVGSLEKVLVTSVPRSAGEVAYGFMSLDNRNRLESRVDRIFSSQHVEQIWKNFSDVPGSSWTENILGVNARTILNPAFAASLYAADGTLNRNARSIRLFARDHTNKWAARAPIRLLHGDIDKEVSYEVNGKPVVASMKAAGTTDIQLITVPGDHVTAWQPALIGAATWLATQRKA